MADLNGFVKIYRQIIKWGWYRDVPVKVLFLHCLFMANYQEDNLHGKTIERGSFVTSVDELSQQTGLTVQNTRTALKKLISTGEITKKSTNKYTVITVVNYDKFQKVSQSLTSKLTNTLTNEQQTANKQLTNKLTNRHTIIKEDKEIKKIKNIEEVVEGGICFDRKDELEKAYPKMDWEAYDEADFSIKASSFYVGQGVVFLSTVQEDILLEQIGADATKYYIQKLADFIISKNANVKNHYATILKWSSEDKQI